jgi:hypothetical protein
MLIDKRKPRLPEDEESLQREERNDEVIKYGIREVKHPHEMQTPVGEDPREYVAEELKEQGYSEEGLIKRDEDKDEKANPKAERSDRIA